MVLEVEAVKHIKRVQCCMTINPRVCSFMNHVLSSLFLKLYPSRELCCTTKDCHFIIEGHWRHCGPTSRHVDRVFVASVHPPKSGLRTTCFDSNARFYPAPSTLPLHDYTTTSFQLWYDFNALRLRAFELRDASYLTE